MANGHSHVIAVPANEKPAMTTGPKEPNRPLEKTTTRVTNQRKDPLATKQQASR